MLLLYFFKNREISVLSPLVDVVSHSSRELVLE